MTTDFGKVTFQGKEYTMQNDADFTGRCLLEWQTEEGYAEFSAQAKDDEGNEYRVYWVLQSRDVEDLEDLNWNNPERVVEI